MKELANYCLGCINKPCSKGCPLNNDISEFIKLFKEDKIKEAYELLCETTVLQSICGRICPHTKQCEGKCIRSYKGEPVSIGKLESYIGDEAIKNNWEIPTSHETKKEKIAIIGSGPAGLTCAAFLKRAGYQVTIYEKHNYLGGLLRHGIPEFRLSKNTLDEVINKIISLGIEVQLNKELGKDISLNDLEKEYDCIFIGIGANLSSKMNIPGEELDGVYGGNELLELNNHPNYEGKEVIVSGGGNVAMDVARTIKKLGAKKVTIVYRRSENEMPAEIKEIKEAKEEGIEFLLQTNILSIKGNNKVEELECIKTELVTIEGEARLSPVNVEGSNFNIKADYCIMAVGSHPEETITNKLNIELDKKGRIIVDEKQQTSNKKIFAGGDISSTEGTVAFAARHGRIAASSIIEYLNNKSSN